MIEASRVEVAGEIVDEFTGKRWAVPVDNCDDLADRVAPNPMAMPPGREDPRFHYQWIRENQWSEYQALGAVRVTMKEFSGDEPSTMDEEYGKPLTSYVAYESAYLIKMPKHVYEQRQRQQDEDAALAMRDILHPRKRQLSDGARGTVEEGTVATVTSEEMQPPRQGGQRRS